jgi:cell shape-determining protein MreC
MSTGSEPLTPEEEQELATLEQKRTNRTITESETERLKVLLEKKRRYEAMQARGR